MTHFSHHNIRLLTWFNFFVDFRLYGPIAIIHFAQVSGSFALGLAVFSFASLATTVFEIPTGVLSDRVGRKMTMTFGALASVAGVILYAMADSFWFLVVGSVFIGLAESFFSGNNNALLYDTLKGEGHEERYGEALGRVSSMFQAGLGVSALIGGLFADWSLAFVFWLSAIPQVACLVMSFFFREPKRHYDEVETNVFSHLGEAIVAFRRNWALRNLSLAAILRKGIGESVHQFVPAFYAMLWPTWALGIPRMLAHFLAWFGFRASGFFIRRWKPMRTLLFGTIANRFIGVLAFGWPTVASPLISSSCSFLYGVNMVSQESLIQKGFTDAQRATMGSLNSFFGNLVFAAFAFVLGSVADAIGVASTLLMGEVLLLVIVTIHLRVFRKIGAV